MKKIYPALIYLFLLISNTFYAQDISKDSVQDISMNRYSNRLFKLEQQRIIDSMKRIQLEIRLESLQSRDTSKRQDLEKQLNELNGRDSLRVAAKRQEIDKLRHSVKGQAVTGLFKDTLFYIYTKQGSFSAAERAKIITGRIKTLGDNMLFNADSLKVVSTDETTDLLYLQDALLSISQNDALWNTTTKDSLANTYRNKIVNEIKRYKQETSVVTLAKEIGLALLVLCIMGLFIFIAGRIFGVIKRKIISQKDTRIKGIKVKSYELFNAERQVNALLFLNTVIKWIFIIILIYISLPILFGIFPWTQNFSETLLGYILKPVKRAAFSIWNYMPKLITIVLLVIVFRYILKFANFLKDEIEHGKLKINGFYPDWANPTYQILRVLILAFLLVLIFPYLPGSSSPIFQGVSVFLGFLFTFGSVGSLSNIIAGIVLTYMRLFKINDRVKIGDAVGDVIEKSLLVTRIRTIKNEIVSIPNSTVMNSHTINYSIESRNKGLIMHTTVTFGYDIDRNLAEAVLLEAAGRTELLLTDPAPFVLQTGFEDFYVSYQINAYTKKAARQAYIYSELNKNIMDCCYEHGIEMLSSHYSSIRDGNDMAMPSNQPKNK